MHEKKREGVYLFDFVTQLFVLTMCMTYVIIMV